MKVHEVKLLKIFLTNEENKKLKIIDNKENIDKEKIKKYTQRFNIISVVGILDISKTKTEDGYNILLTVEIKG
jgi:hypothetical protein